MASGRESGVVLNDRETTYMTKGGMQTMQTGTIAVKTTAKCSRNTYLCIIASVFFLMTLTFGVFSPKTAYAAGAGITIQEINYDNSTVTVKVNSGDTVVYFSDENMKTWEAIPTEIGSDRLVTLDISWISPTNKYVLTFKGDASTEVVKVTIPKQVTNFKASYNKVRGIVTFTNDYDRTIQWRKKDSYIWNTVNTNTFASQLEMLCTQGATVYLRLAPTNSYLINGSLTEGERQSKEISIVIPKKTAAPNIVINGSKFSIQADKNLAYRAVESDGTLGEWKNITTTTSLWLKDIAGSALYTNAGTPQSEVTLQFRKNPTSTSQVSHISTVTVPVQEAPPSESDHGIEINYTSSTTFTLQVKAASETKPFEYTIVKPDNTLDYVTASWTSITSNAEITIKSDKAPTGSHVYVRKKSVPASGDIKFSLSSKEVDTTGSKGVQYPSPAQATALETLITTASVCNSENTAGNLTFTLYSPTKATVSSISFRDQYGSTKGTVTLKSSVSTNTASRFITDQYIITTKITSTENLDTLTETKLYAYITLSNNDVIESTIDSGVLLYIYPSSKVNNKDNKDYTSAFERLYSSTEASDKSSFTFKIDLGTEKVPDTSTIGNFTTQDTEVKSIKYDGYTLTPTTDYQVVYGSYTNDNGKKIRTATVTVNVNKFETHSTITTKGKATPLIITLNNGEEMDNKVTIKLVDTATLLDAPIAWSIMEGSLKETETKTTTKDDGSKTTETVEVITYELKLKLHDNSYAVGISDVTWDGTSILRSASVSGGTATIYLSNAKINKLTSSSSTTNNLVITLSNGFVIKSGCKLTIINAGK